MHAKVSLMALSSNLDASVKSCSLGLAKAHDRVRRLGRTVGLSATLILATALASPAFAQRSQIAPEAATGRTERELATAGRYMVAAANPLAVAAGLEMLEDGGSATDAAIAVQLVLGLVEPQSSGLGGGAFLLHWNAQKSELSTYDGRETAPAAAKPDRFVQDGKPMPFDKAIISGLSVGTPGVVRLMDAVHRAHGKLPWPRLFGPAVKLADDGFRVSPRLSKLLAEVGAGGFDPAARRYFFPDGNAAIAAGTVLRNPEYAATLRRIAAERGDGFYSGSVAAAIVAAAKSAANAAGDLTIDDLQAYQVQARDPVCTTYRKHRICGMGPPSSGGIAVAQTLKLLEGFDLGRGRAAAMNPRALHLIAEAEKLAFADRDRYVADPAFIAVPEGLLEQAYIDRRRRLIGARAMARPSPGEPRIGLGHVFGDDATTEAAGTSHVSIVDRAGDAVSMTTTIEAAFGSRLLAAGFLLNNQLTDFSRQPLDPTGKPIANRVEAGKRPRSSMAPTLVFDEAGRLKVVVGSPGGARIILYVVKALVALIDWELDAQAAAAAPNFGSRGGAFEIEADATHRWSSIAALWWGREPRRFTPWHALHMTALGHTLQLDAMTSGLHMIVLRAGRLEGGADPRREGEARGQ